MGNLSLLSTDKVIGLIVLIELVIIILLSIYNKTQLKYLRKETSNEPDKQEDSDKREMTDPELEELDENIRKLKRNSEALKEKYALAAKNSMKNLEDTKETFFKFFSAFFGIEGEYTKIFNELVKEKIITTKPVDKLRFQTEYILFFMNRNSEVFEFKGSYKSILESRCSPESSYVYKARGYRRILLEKEMLINTVLLLLCFNEAGGNLNNKMECKIGNVEELKNLIMTNPILKPSNEATLGMLIEKVKEEFDFTYEMVEG